MQLALTAVIAAVLFAIPLSVLYCSARTLLIHEAGRETSSSAATVAAFLEEDIADFVLTER
ncbi:MAG: hypothetical protein R2826_07865 [Thermoleophilia bacterium]